MCRVSNKGKLGILDLILFGSPPGRGLERLLVDFGIQNGRFWDTKMVSKLGPVIRTAIFKKSRKNQWFFQYFDVLRGSDFQ